MHVKLFARMVIEVALACIVERNEEGMRCSSARVSLEDAVHLFARGEYKDAFERALTSLKYSVGCLAPEFRWANYLNWRI